MTTSAFTRATALLLALPLLLGVDVLQSRNRATEDGNQRLKSGKPEEALAEYDKAAKELPNDPGVQFNRGNALYALSRFDEASEAFLRATEAKARDRKAAAFYSLGTSYYQAKKWGEAVAAFKKSLAYDPTDLRAKWNLELALRKKTDEDKNGDKNKDKNANNDKNKKDDKDNKDKPNQDKDDKNKTAEDDKKGNDKSDEQRKNEQDGDKKPPEQQNEQAKEEAKKDEKKNESGKSQQAQNDKGAGKPPEQPRPGTDPREVEAILDNLEKSPKSLETELAKVRAAQRRPAAKDW